MTNRQKLGNMCIYDLLVKISEAMLDCCSCIIEAITGEEQDCPYSITDNKGCPECLQNWLNKEVK